jgi:hypothetical protein
VGETGDGGAFLVMELVKGKSLRDHLAAGTPSVAKRIAALVEVGRGVAFAHDAGFVHRDIKPDNVMIRDDGRAVILDFGLAKPHVEGVTSAGATLTAKGTFVGTPAYMAPEQARGEDVDGRCDQFALAVTIFEAATGTLPWRGKSAIEIVSEILQAAPRRLREVQPDLLAALDEALSRALEKKPGDRFPTMRDFVDAVERAMPQAASASTSGSAPTGRAAAAELAHAPTVAASISGSVSPARAAPRLPSRRWLGAAAALFVVLVGAGALLRNRTTPAAGPAAPAPAPVLARAGSTLACPVFVATAYDFPNAGWLGAAAAHLACERAAIGLGDSSRSLVPAELLGLPRVPAEDFPGEPFDSPETRAKTVAAAQQADAWLDGTIDRRPEGFRVTIALRERGRSVAARGDGAGETVLWAVREAMAPLLASGALPRVEGSAWLRSWMDGTTVEGALALHDLHVALLNENTDEVRGECAAVRARSDLGSMLETFARTVCADKLGEPVPAPPPARHESPAELATSASIARLRPAKGAEDRARLEHMARSLEEASAREPGSEARALLAAVASEVWYSLAEGEQAHRLALLSVQASPRQVDVRGTAWHRLAFTSRDRLGVLDPHAAWLPWEAFAHANIGRLKRDPASAKEGAHRAAVMAGGGYWVINYGEILVDVGDTTRASAVAAVAHSPSLTVKVMRAEGQLRGALEAGISALANLPATTAESGEAARLAADTAELSAILERSPSHLQDFYDRFLAPDPPPFSRGVIPYFSALSACLQAPKPLAARCVGRIGDLFRAGHFGAAYIGAADALSGAEKYVAGDLAGATRAWRPMLSRAVLTVQLMRDVVAQAYDRAGDAAVADRADAFVLENDSYVCLAFVRAALRAGARNDCATARRYAQEVVDKWEAADEKPPSVDRMKKLIERCGH